MEQKESKKKSSKKKTVEELFDKYVDKVNQKNYREETGKFYTRMYNVLLGSEKKVSPLSLRQYMNDYSIKLRE